LPSFGLELAFSITLSHNPSSSALVALALAPRKHLYRLCFDTVSSGSTPDILLDNHIRRRKSCSRLSEPNPRASASNVDMAINLVSRHRSRNTINHGNAELQGYLDEDSDRCAMSLRSELRSVETLLRLSKRCLCPKLKTHAEELHERRVKLKDELTIRLEEKKLWG
jgi:hypothetical protein